MALAVILLALVLASPHIAWRLMPARTLGVVLVDKTVPFKNFREHAAIPWILHALKVVNADGKFMEASHDYVGYDPAARLGHDLDAHDLERADVLVITDTYGVYKGDYEKPGDIAALERSPKIYGGFDENEATVIERFVGRGGMVLAEFNTFASPTEDATRARLENLFGVRWTHWVGRYWPDLQDPNEVPKWVGRVYERIYKKPFDVKGAGLVFVREDADMVVLRAGEDLGPNVITQTRTAKGAAYDFPETGSFWFWMDILDTTDGEVLFEHIIDVTTAGEQKLTAHHLPQRFPALVRKRDAFYFAGDFVDNSIDLGNPERVGLVSYKRRVAGCGGGVTEEGFFWGWYAPIVSRLLSSRAEAPK